MSLSFMKREAKYRKKVSFDWPLLNQSNDVGAVQIKKKFTKVDKTGDGKLSKEQWLQVLSASGCQTSM